MPNTHSQYIQCEHVVNHQIDISFDSFSFCLHQFIHKYKHSLTVANVSTPTSSNLNGYLYHSFSFQCTATSHWMIHGALLHIFVWEFISMEHSTLSSQPAIQLCSYKFTHAHKFVCQQAQIYTTHKNLSQSQPTKKKYSPYEQLSPVYRLTCFKWYVNLPRFCLTEWDSVTAAAAVVPNELRTFDGATMKTFGTIDYL